MSCFVTGIGVTMTVMPDRPRARRILSPTVRAELCVSEEARRRYRLIRRAELEVVGVSGSAISRWVARGRLRRRYRGVYVYGGGKLTTEGEFLAAVLAIGDDAVLTHFGAAALRGFWNGGWKPIDITVPRRVSSRNGIRVHVDELPADSVMTFLGIPVTTPTRAALDIAATRIPQKRFRRLVHEGEAQDLITPELIQAEIELAPWHPGASRLLAETADGPKPTRSGKEDDLVDMLRRHKAPRFVTNAHVPGTPAWVTADVMFIDHRLVIEYDGGPWHDTEFRKEVDAYKRGLIGTAGWGVLVLRDGDVEPDTEPVTMEAIWGELAIATPARPR